MSLAKKIIVKTCLDGFLKIGKIDLSEVKKMKEGKAKEILLNIFFFDIIATEEEFEQEFSFHQENDDCLLTYPEFKNYISTLSEDAIHSLTSLCSIHTQNSVLLSNEAVKEIEELLKPISKQISGEMDEQVLVNFFETYNPKKYELKILCEIRNN